MYSKKGLIKIPATLILLFSSACGPQATQTSQTKDTVIESSASDFSVATLGFGYNTKSETFKGHCVTGDWELAGPKTAFASFDRSLSREELAESLGFKIGGRGRYGLLKAKATANFARSSSESRYSEVTVYSASYRFQNKLLKDARLTETGRIANSSPEQWEYTCGQEFVEQIQLGANIYISAKIEFSNEKKKEEFNSKVNLKGSAFSVAAEVNKIASEFRESASITIRALQIGGDVTRLSTIFSGAKVDEVEKNINATITCSMAAPDSCLKVLTNALIYATDVHDPEAFPRQLDLNLDEKSPKGPSHLGYITKPWSNLALHVGSKIVPADVLAARKVLSQEFETNISNSERLINLRGIPGRMAPGQLALIVKLQAIVLNNLNLLAEVGNACYETLDTCAETLAATLPKLTTIEPSDLKFQYAPIAAGLFHHKGTVYSSDGSNYCGFASVAHYKLSSGHPWNDWINLSDDDGYAEVMNYTGPCPALIPAGLFHSVGTVYYANDKGHYCSFNSPAHYFDASGAAWAAWTDYGSDYIPFEKTMTYDGQCAVKIPEGFFSAKDIPGIFWSNGHDAYCWIPAPKYVSGPVKEYPYDVHSATHMRRDGVCPGM